MKRSAGTIIFTIAVLLISNIRQGHFPLQKVSYFLGKTH